MKSKKARCWTYSHSPTPPAWGHTGTPNLAAMITTAMSSLTPPRRHESIWQKSIASACRNCLNITRLWAASPVATPIPNFLRDCRILAWARMSSGLVGSSIQTGLNWARRVMLATASSVLQRWLASIMRGLSQPIWSLITWALLASSSTFTPTWRTQENLMFAKCCHSREKTKVGVLIHSVK